MIFKPGTILQYTDKRNDIDLFVEITKDGKTIIHNNNQIFPDAIVKLGENDTVMVDINGDGQWDINGPEPVSEEGKKPIPVDVSAKIIDCKKIMELVKNDNAR